VRIESHRNLKLCPKYLEKTKKELEAKILKYENLRIYIKLAKHEYGIEHEFGIVV